ncbi:MAG TPA: D-TA family PLP-dependent enzyme [Verrucomicrobiae bacterium]|jgi:D-serine deaminase-like pyridoxal phosphate-dependent protein
MSDGWHQVTNTADVASPSLLLYASRVEENIRRMIAMAGDVNRLRPHIKTHKMPEMIRLQLERGIRKFKCATLVEAEMAALNGAKDILIAYQLVGPNIGRFFGLVARFPSVQFTCVADNADSICALSDFTRGSGRVEVLLDLDIGQHRTGVAPDSTAIELYRLVAASPGLAPGGLHAYDGHIHNPDVAERTAECEAAFAPVELLRRKLEREGWPVPRVVTSGTPTFPMHARREGVECSPGTCVFWDAGSARKLPDMDFLPAAVLLTRVVSKPTANRLCLDLGHKAVASEMPHPRVVFLNLNDATPVVHSEEHLVVEMPHAVNLSVGDCIYGIPWHICPTVALHSEVVVVRNARAEERWKVAARDRSLTIEKNGENPRKS